MYLASKAAIRKLKEPSSEDSLIICSALKYRECGCVGSHMVMKEVSMEAGEGREVKYKNAPVQAVQCSSKSRGPARL